MRELKEYEGSFTPNFMNTDSIGRSRTPRAHENLTGRKFMKLTAIRRFFRSIKDGCIYWECSCECGNLKIFRASDLKALKINSCGCDVRTLGKKTHGLCKTRVHRIWKAMKTRCLNKNSPHYKNYGGRGITISEEWKASFEVFLKDMGQPPSDIHTIDRINNDAEYSKENCKWADRIEQANNTRANYRITYNGETKTLEQWARVSNVNSATISRRIKEGWEIKDAIFETKRTQGYKDYNQLRKKD